MFSANVDVNSLTDEVLDLVAYLENGQKDRLTVLESLGNYYLENSCYDYAMVAFRESLKKNPNSEFTQKSLDRLSKWEKIVRESPIFNKRIVCTGTFEIMRREKVYMLIECFGGLTSNSPTNDMDYLVVGYSEWSEYNNGLASRKIQKAAELQSKGRDIKIVGETEFIEILKGIAKPILSEDAYDSTFNRYFEL